MRGIAKRWIFEAGTDAAAHAWPVGSAAANHPIVARLLAARGLHTWPEDELAGYLDPRLTRLHDPSLMPGLDRAAERFLRALRNGEQVVIYGDYDVDGVTASAVLYHIAAAVAPQSLANVRCYVPHRVDEGYGLNADAIRSLAADGASLIISVDCGITAVHEAAIARELGVDLVITDHHTPPGSTEDGGTGLPDAYAVVHPRLPGSAYPYGELCGAGVAFKLAWRVATLASGVDAGGRVSNELRAVLLDLLAYAALGTIADVVPLVGENRVIARAGLAAIQPAARRPTPRLAGVGALVRAARLDNDRIDAMAVGFKLGPMLNAAGRLAHAAEAIELFTTADDVRAAEIAAGLDAINQRRRSVEKRILDQAAEMAEAAGMTTDDRRAIVLAHDDWHPGVVGIVCSRLVERFGRPAILMQRTEEGFKGSGRSIDGFNLHAALCACSSHLRTFGGHDMAAGLALEADGLDGFVESFLAHTGERIACEDLVPTLRVDCAADIGELTRDAVAALDALGPFGRSNPAPRLLLSGAVLAERPRLLGQHGRHLSMSVRDAAAGPRSPALRLVAWNQGEHLERLGPGMAVDAVVSPKISSYNGRVEAEVKDFRVCAHGDSEPQVGMRTAVGVRPAAASVSV